MFNPVFDSQFPHGADRPGITGPTVGVLGGMGPAATADFYSKLISATPASIDQEHLRVIIWSDPTTPDRTQALLQSGTDPTPWLVYGARMLADAGADVIAVPCNTAHAFLPAVAERVGVPVIHMIKHTSYHLRTLRPRVQRVGLLATTGTVRARLYEKWLGDAEIGLLVPTADSQAGEVMPTIEAIKAGRNAPRLLERAAHRLVDRGAQAIIAGCTEVPLGFRPHKISVPMVDPTRVLAEAIVGYVRGETGSTLATWPLVGRHSSHWATAPAIPARTSDAVYERLKEAIIRGDLEPGERLRDSEVAKRLGLNRTPVCEALTRLEGTGLVAAEPGVHARITTLNHKDVADTLGVVRSLDEPAVRTGVPLLTAGDIDRMGRANEEFTRAIGRDDVVGACAADDAFHSVVIAASGNPVLHRMIDQLHPQVHRILYRKFSYHHGGCDTINHHTKLLELCRGRDADGAAQLSAAHWGHLGGLIDELFADDLTPGEAQKL